MPLRSSLLILFGILASLTISFAAPAEILGDNTSLTWRLGGALQYNDNIFLDSVDTESDTIMVFSPGVELNVGSAPSNANLKVIYIHDFITYSDNTKLNRDNPNLRLTGFLKSPKSSIAYGVSYKENTQNDASNNLAGDLAHRNVLNANVNGELEMSAKSSISTAYQMQDVQYDNQQFHDRENYTVPVNYYWSISPKMDMSVGYRYRNTSFQRDGLFLRNNPGNPSNKIVRIMMTSFSTSVFGDKSVPKLPEKFG